MSSADDRYSHVIHQSNNNRISVSFYMSYDDALKRKYRLVEFDFISLDEALVFFDWSPDVLRTLNLFLPDGSMNGKGIDVVCDPTRVYEQTTVSKNIVP